MCIGHIIKNRSSEDRRRETLLNEYSNKNEKEGGKKRAGDKSLLTPNDEESENKVCKHAYYYGQKGQKWKLILDIEFYDIHFKSEISYWDWNWTLMLK